MILTEDEIRCASTTLWQILFTIKERKYTFSPGDVSLYPAVRV